MPILMLLLPFSNVLFRMKIILHLVQYSIQPLFSHFFTLLFLQLYIQIVNAQMDYPANWDKNLALAAERLLHLGGGHRELESLLNHSIHHFSRYIEKEPTDPQSSAIRFAIEHLSKEMDRLVESHRKTQH